MMRNNIFPIINGSEDDFYYCPPEVADRIERLREEIEDSDRAARIADRVEELLRARRILPDPQSAPAIGPPARSKRDHAVAVLREMSALTGIASSAVRTIGDIASRGGHGRLRIRERRRSAEGDESDVDIEVIVDNRGRAR